MKGRLLLIFVALAALAWLILLNRDRGSAPSPAEDLASGASAAGLPESVTFGEELQRSPVLQPTDPGLAQHLELPAQPPPRDAIHGRILSAEGAGVEGALVRIWPLAAPPSVGFLEPGSGRATAVAAAVHSGSDGRFQIPGPLLGNFRLEAEHGGRTERRFPIPAGDYVEIRMGSGCRIAGSVRCEDHTTEVFQGSFWLAEDVFDNGAFLAAEVARDGSFAFEGIPPGSYVVNSSLDGHVVGFGVNLNLPDWGAEIPLILTVRAGLLFAGQVRDEDTGRPIAGATVWVGPLNHVTALTDAEGRFRLDNITPQAGEWHDFVEVIVRAPDYLKAELPFKPATDRLILLERAPPLPLKITGRLLEHDGKPVSGAQLHAEGRDYQDSDGGMIPALQRWTKTEADGSFLIAWDLNLATSIQVEHTAMGASWIFLGKVVKDRELGDLRLPAALTWNLRITDESGSPAAGAEVAMSLGSYSLPQDWLNSPDWLAGPIPFASPSRTTDSYGRCQIVCGPMESTDFTVRFGQLNGWSFPAPPPGGEEHVLVLEGLRRVRGRVTDATGEPVSAGFISIIDPQDDDGSDDGVISGEMHPLAEDGRFQFDGRYPPAVILTLHLFGTATGKVRWDGIALDDRQIELVMPALLPCAGVVQDAAGRPLPEVMVLAGMGEEGEVNICRTDAEGRFTFGMLPDARLRLVAQDDDGGRSAPQEVVAGTTGIVLQVQE